jgi:hypothetical protein
MNNKFIESKLKQLILGKKRRVRGYPASSYIARCEFLDQVRKFYTDQDVKIIQDAIQKALERKKENQTNDCHHR